MVKYFSKTDYIEYLQCPKCLWLKKNKSDVYIGPELTDFDKKNFKEGQEVDIVVRDLFPGGQLASGTTEEQIVQTKKMIDNKTPIIYQASFSSPDSSLLAKIDILKYNPKNNNWDIYEAKSSTSIKTDIKHNHIKDVTFQKIVADMAGVSIGDTYIVCLNKDYRKNGGLELDKLFVINKISEDVEGTKQIAEEEIQQALSFLDQQEIDLRSCACLYLTRPNHCSSFSVLNSNIPEYSVHDISRIGAAKLKNLVDSKIFSISDIPDNFELTAIQEAQVILEKTQQPQIDIEKVAELLDGIAEPIYFIDYETFASAIPILDGFGPHQHIPFQVSIHKLTPSGELEHYEYLAEDVDNAVSGVIGLMKDVIQSEGSLVSWHASFENTRNKEIAEIYPEHKDFLYSLIDRTFDLEAIFLKHYKHPGFKGKTSIKKVLPVLIPDFSYENLDIQGGTEAMESWRKIIADELSTEEVQSIRNNLLEYCKMDTLAMVEIYKYLLK